MPPVGAAGGAPPRATPSGAAQVWVTTGVPTDAKWIYDFAVGTGRLMQPCEPRVPA